jgi:hypothetical protein
VTSCGHGRDIGCGIIKEHVNRLYLKALGSTVPHVMALLCATMLACAVPVSASSLSTIASRSGKQAFVQIAVEGVNRGVVAGEFRWNVDPEAPAGYDNRFYRYCVEARNALVENGTVAIRSTDLLTVAGVPDAGGKGAWLFNTYGPSIRGAMSDRHPRDRAAALQVAIWEAMLETPSDLSTGTMKLASDADVREQAKNHLVALYKPDGSYKGSDATWLDLSGTQEQLALPGLPEPGTLLMCATGLTVAMAIRRWRRRSG